jgi:hypothetical protein
MGARGTGLRILGSATWGGTPYISIIVSVLFLLLVVPRLYLSTKQLRLIVFGGVGIGIFSTFLKYAGFVSEVADTESVGAVRLSWLTPLAFSLAPLVALKLRVFWRYLLMAAVVAMMAMTGYRSKMVGMMVVFWLFELCRRKEKKSWLGFSVVAGLALWIFVIGISSFLPRGMQRAVSFVPGAQIDMMVAMDAQHSIDWRVEIWNYAWEDLDRYWLIGRGVAFDVLAAIEDLGLAAGSGNTFQAYHTHTYHSGPITALIDFGVPGALVLLGFMIAAGKYLVRHAKKIMTIDTFEARYVLYLCVSLLWQFIAFWFVFGDVYGIARMFMSFSVIVVLLQTVNRDSDSQGPDALVGAE